MIVEFAVIGAVVGGGLWWANANSKKNKARREEEQFHDALADARRWTERLGGQVMNVAGSDTASTQAMADASERFTAANAAIARATTAKQALLARESALEGMHYVQAARDIMGMPAGPELPPLEGQRAAGKVTEERTIEHEGQKITASPYASAATPNYYPGGKVAGRPVPAGWYSTPWWADAMATGVWMMGYSMMFNSLFMGMSGVGYGGDVAEAGGVDAIDGGAEGVDAGDMGDAGDAGGDAGDGGGLFGGEDGGLFGGDGFDFDFDF